MILFQRHGQAVPEKDSFGIDMLRPLTGHGKHELALVMFPSSFTPKLAFVSPATRTIESFDELAKTHRTLTFPTPIMLPEMYAPIFLTEMEPLFTEFNEKVKGYIESTVIPTGKAVCEQAAERVKRAMDLRGGPNTDTIIVSHTPILSLMAVHLFPSLKDSVADIDLGTGQGFCIDTSRNKPIIARY